VYGPRPDDWDNPLLLERSKVEKILDLYVSGVSAPDVAKTTGVAKSTVLRHLRANGIKIRGATKDLDMGQIVQMRDSGVSCRKIAEHYGVAPATITRRLRELKSGS